MNSFLNFQLYTPPSELIVLGVLNTHTHTHTERLFEIICDLTCHSLLRLLQSSFHCHYEIKIVLTKVSNNSFVALVFIILYVPAVFDVCFNDHIKATPLFLGLVEPYFYWFLPFLAAFSRTGNWAQLVLSHQYSFLGTLIFPWKHSLVIIIPSYFSSHL